MIDGRKLLINLDLMISGIYNDKRLLKNKREPSEKEGKM